MGWPTKRRKSGRSEEGDYIYDSLGNLVKTTEISINYVSRGQFFFFYIFYFWSIYVDSHDLFN